MLFVVLGLFGLWLWFWRMGPRFTARDAGAAAAVPVARGAAASWPVVSVIVPARNEAAHLPVLLNSLMSLDYPRFEVIVVDDGSTDGTGEIAARYGVRLVTGRQRPEGWLGKQWACHQGASVAQGEVLLFTDADTWHQPDSLRRAVTALDDSGASLLSTLPYHDAPPGTGLSLWERLMGPFHLLLLALTAPWGEPKPRRVYAIGQYLMFRRDAYVQLGGHAAVRAEFVEDLPLANLCLKSGLRYEVHHGPSLMSVRMYDCFADFVAGWRRNFRAGMRYSSPWAPIEATAMIAALTGGGKLFSTWPAAILCSATIVFLISRQRRLGRFSPLGAVLFPFSLACFCWVSALAAFDMVAKRPLVWKDRAYGGISIRRRAR